MQTRVIILSIAAMLAFTVGGCGVRGSLETPKATPDATASADSGQGKAEGEGDRPHKGFVLDGLLR